MNIILNLLTFHGDVFLEDRMLLTRYGVQCKFSVTVTVTVSSLFFHVHHTEPVKSEGLFCKLYFCGCCGSILPVVQFGMYKIKGKYKIYLG